MRSASWIAPAACLTILAGCSTTNHAGSGRSGKLDAARSGFFRAWTKHEGIPFNPAGLEASLDNSAEFLSFDGMYPQGPVIDGFPAYIAIWGPGMNGFKTADLSETKLLRSWSSGDMAVTASLVRVRGVLPDGNTLETPGHMTLTWRWSDGSWRVVHEHMSLPVKQ